jgi:hypothetical protein
MQKLMQRLVRMLRGRAAQRRLARFIPPAPRPSLRWFLADNAAPRPALAPIIARTYGPR